MGIKDEYISIYVRNAKEGPSDYYRVIQYIEKMNQNVIIHNAVPLFLFRLNLNVNSYFVKKIVQAFLYCVILVRRLISILYDFINKPSVVIVQRELYPRYIPFVGRKLLEKLLQKNAVIWDFDDDIFQSEISKYEAAIMQKNSNVIVVTSDYLKSLLPRNCHKKIITLPTTDQILDLHEMENVFEKRRKSFENEVRLVWVGTAVNLKNLDLVIKYIEVAGKQIRMKYKKRLVFTIVCNQTYKYDSKFFQVRNIRWSREIARKEINNAHIGIMPLIDDTYSLGKGGFKLVQYLSAGLPVIASDVGFNKNIVDNGENGFLLKNDKKDEWVISIIKLIEEYERWKEYAHNSIKKYIKKYAYEANYNTWETLIISLQKERRYDYN